jgi:hypothetical protein
MARYSLIATEVLNEELSEQRKQPKDRGLEPVPFNERSWLAVHEYTNTRMALRCRIRVFVTVSRMAWSVVFERYWV